jgi:hypothetical protein
MFITKGAATYKMLNADNKSPAQVDSDLVQLVKPEKPVTPKKTRKTNKI